MSQLREENSVKIRIGSAIIEGNLQVPEGAEGVVIFAHGSGSGRFSPRNRFVAAELNKVGLATLLIDLLTAEEEDKDQFTGEFRFNITLLADRLVGAVEWLKKHDETKHLHIGVFGASTGSAAALIAAARLPTDVRAVVSRGGRPDLAMGHITEVTAPTLLIVGGTDEAVILLNKRAMELMGSEKRLEIIPGASHLFEEPGTLKKVAKFAAEWFIGHL
jgi:putative phosphoribosyl transferase